MGSVPQNRPATALLAKGSTGNPRTKAAAESAVHPAKEARRKSARQANRSPPRGSASPEIHTPKQRQRAFCFVESPENARPSSGFSASKPVRHGSSSGRSSPGSRAPERRQRAFCFVESPENARQSSGFSASKSVRRGSSSGRASPGKNVPSQPELVLRQRFRREATR